MFILKEVKVLCFDTDLQVLIPNEIEEGSRVDEKRDASGTAGTVLRPEPRDAERGYATPGVLQKESASY